MNSDFVVAVHSLVFLNHHGKTMRSEDIAKNVCTNPARVRKVLSKIKSAGLVATKEGALQGGYMIALDPKEITLRRVLEALEDHVIELSWKSGSEDMDCLIASGMSNLMTDIIQGLDDHCKTDLEKITIWDIEKKIFGQ